MTRLLLALAALLLGAGAPAAGAPPVPRLDHVVVVVLENRERSEVFSRGAAPSLQRWAREYANLTDYRGVAHPSLPNYLALVSGSTHGITSDCTDCLARGPSLGTLLNRSGRTWAGYAEGYPGSARFAKKHMPFLYFPGQERHVHDLSALDPRRLPAFALVAPDLCNDAHDCSLPTADRFLSRLVPPLLRVPRTAVFVIFDEGRSDLGGGGRVAAVVLGTAVRRHATYTGTCTHYCLLRTVEDALGVPHLGASSRARPITRIWR